jgi:lysophospholipase L1-like esterase
MGRAGLPWRSWRRHAAALPGSRKRAWQITGSGLAALLAITLIPASASSRPPARPSPALATGRGVHAATSIAVKSAGGTGGYVSLGDSYTAGPFIPQPVGTPAGCLRSNHGYPAVVAAAIHPASFQNDSCSGAVTGNMAGPQPVYRGPDPPQFRALKPDTSLVTVQIGGNDIGFLGIVEHCGELSIANPAGAPCKAHYAPGGKDQLSAEIQQTAPKVAWVLQRIHQLSPGARVLLLGYPVILPNTGNGCWPAMPIAYGDVPYLRGVELELNKMLAAQAAANGATFVNTYTDSIGHDVCQVPGTRWVEGLVPTSPAAPFHPNALGEQAMAKQVLAALG